MRGKIYNLPSFLPSSRIHHGLREEGTVEAIARQCEARRHLTNPNFSPKISEPHMVEQGPCIRGIRDLGDTLRSTCSPKSPQCHQCLPLIEYLHSKPFPRVLRAFGESMISCNAPPAHMFPVTVFLLATLAIEIDTDGAPPRGGWGVEPSGLPSVGGMPTSREATMNRRMFSAAFGSAELTAFLISNWGWGFRLVSSQTSPVSSPYASPLRLVFVRGLVDRQLFR
mmetsp:Transcript_621/g.1274  ORF Transcript_621/g.1274 Transcript_621/m.1274 type:complete len:225 (-) Transcript_621:733-1407(-)